MLTLYHGTRSVCSAKVRIALAEKQLAYESRLVDLYTGEQFELSYLKLNPLGVVPTLVDDRGPITESSIIIQYVDELSQENPLMPRDPHDAARVRLYLLRCLDIHSATNSLTFATAGRHRELKKSVVEREASYRRMPDKEAAAKRRDLVDNGFDSPFVDKAVHTFAGLFRQLECDLARSGADWIVGHFSLADIALIAYVDRLDRLGLNGFWAITHPNVARWLANFKRRPSYTSEIEAYNSAAHAPDAYEPSNGREAWRLLDAKLAAAGTEIAKP